MSEELLIDGYTVRIEQDDCYGSNPRRDWDGFGTMVCFHRRYDLGDDPKQHGFQTPEDLTEFLEKEKPPVILPLYLLDHSGLWMRTGRFEEDYGGWDTSMVGYIFLTQKDIDEHRKYCPDTTIEDLERQLKHCVETYSQYLSGDVYWFEVVDPEGEQIDSCGGFYGYDHEKSGLMELVGNAIKSDKKRKAKLEAFMRECWAY